MYGPCCTHDLTVTNVLAAVLRVTNDAEVDAARVVLPVIVCPVLATRETDETDVLTIVHLNALFTAKLVNAASMLVPVGNVNVMLELGLTSRMPLVNAETESVDVVETVELVAV